MVVCPKEYPGTLYDLPWGLYKEMSTNTRGQSDIVTHSINTGNRVYSLQESCTPSNRL